MATIKRHGTGWQARIRRRGYPQQTKTFTHKAHAERWAREVERAMEAGVFAPTAREAERVTLREALERYRTEVTPRKRSVQPELSRVASLLEHSLADRMLAGVRGADVAALRDELAERLGPHSVRLYLALLSHLYTTAAREWGYEGLPNPCAAVAKPSVAGLARRRRAEGDELQRILAAARALPWWAAPAIELAVETAMRRGELAALVWEHVDLRAAIAHLPKTKNGDARDVPLTPRAVEILAALPRRISGSVFGVGADAISHAFMRARDAAGVEGLRLHDLRREATSRLLDRGDLTLADVQSITGHKTLQQLATYTAPKAVEIAAKLKRRA